MCKVLLIFLISTSVAWAQGTKKSNGGGGPSQSGNNGNGSGNNPGNAGGGGGPTIEIEMTAYDAVSSLADEIVAKTTTAISKQAGSRCSTSNTILLADPVAQSDIVAFYSFKSSTTALQTAYQSLGSSGVGAGAAPTDWISAGLSILVALRNTAVYSGQTFQPDDTVVQTLLFKKIAGITTEPKYRLVSAQAPGNIDGAATSVNAILQAVNDARAQVPQPNQTDYFKALDQQWATLQTSLTTVDSSGNTLLATVINGQALASSLGKCYPQLIVKTIALGGSSRTNHNFFVELFYTTPKPSYNGGAIVAYSVLGGDGTYLGGDTIRLIYDYSKWHPAKDLIGSKNY